MLYNFEISNVFYEMGSNRIPRLKYQRYTYDVHLKKNKIRKLENKRSNLFLWKGWFLLEFDYDFLLLSPPHFFLDNLKYFFVILL